MNYKYLLFILFACYFLSRGIFLLHAPLYNDEAIYLRWIQQFIVHPSQNLFISVSDGKQPLYVWVVSIFLLCIPQPLLAGRIASLFFGGVTMMGLFFLSQKITKNRRVGIFTIIIYLFFIPSFIYDRMAIYESLLACISVGTLYVTFHFFENIKIKSAIILGIFLGLGMLTKTSFIFLLYLLPLPFLIYNYKTYCSKKSFYTVFLLGIAIVLAIVFYLPVVKSANYQIVLGKNATFIYPFHDWLRTPIQFKINTFGSNFFILWFYLVSYIQIPFLLTVCVAMLSKKYMKEKILLLLYCIIPFFSLIVFGRSFNLAPRYIYFMVIFLIPLCGIGVENIMTFFEDKRRKKYLPFIFLFLFVYPIYSCFLILINPLSSPLNTWDKKEYFNMRGFYIMQTIRFLKKDSHYKYFAITTDGVLGLLPEAFQIEWKNDKSVFIKGYYPITTSLPQEIVNVSQKEPTYFISFRDWTTHADFPLQIITHHGLVKDNDSYYVYKVN